MFSSITFVFILTVYKSLETVHTSLLSIGLRAM